MRTLRAHLRPQRLAILLLLSCTLSFAAPARLLVLGDSLSAGYGIPAERAWPQLLQQQLQTAGLDYNVVNLSISGETSSGGRSRISAALKRHQPAWLLLALGANDGLRGLPLDGLQQNLVAIIDTARRNGTQVMLIGMRLPPNYGPYADGFQATFDHIAEQKKTAYLPFLLAPVADTIQYFQADQLHPTAEAQPLLMRAVWQVLQPQLHARTPR